MAGKKTLVLVTIRPLLGISNLPPDAGRGATEIQQIVHAGLAQVDDGGQLHPQLAEEVPTVENGLWNVSPDGRMETTWKLQGDAQWQDGTPVTAGDWVFGTSVQMDRELVITSDPVYRLIDGVEALDASTVFVKWRGVDIEAITLFARPERLLPAHLLEDAYAAMDKESFMGLPYWTDGFVGAGPFRLKEFVPDSHLLLEAFDQYVLGRPRVDEVELKLMKDSSTAFANLLAGTVHMTLGLVLGPDQAAELKKQWRDGTVVATPHPGSTIAIFPQMLDPELPIVNDVRFRRALLYAIDRQALVDTIMQGQGGIAHSMVSPALPEYRDIESAIVRYEYDLRKSEQLLTELGYRRGTSGQYEDAGGSPLAFLLWGREEQPERVSAWEAVTGFWRGVGLDVEPYLIPQAQIRDRERNAQYPAFQVRGVGADRESLRAWFHGDNAPRPENGFRGNNAARYRSAQMDALLARFFATPSLQERTPLLAEFVQHWTDQAIYLGLFYAADQTAASNRVRGVTPGSYWAKGFAAHRWELMD